MGALKRKEAPGGDNPPKKAKSSTDARPSKRNHSDNNGSSHNADTRRTSYGADSAPAPTAQSSIVSTLKEEEPMFPRGGGSVLTPLEQKQIQIEAKADAVQEDEFDTNEKAKVKRERKRKSKTTDLPSGSADEDAVKVDSLNFKISHIGYQSLTVALPNNLTGHVSIAAISEAFTTKLQQGAEASDESDEDEDEDDDFDIETLFKVGQYVRAYVLSTRDDEAPGKPRRHIELSLRPSETNSGLSKNDIVPNVTVMAAVTSVQDHGYEMELGVEDTKLKGFLSKKEAGSVEEERLQPGAVHLCLVKKVSGKIAQLTLDPDNVGKMDAIATEASTVNSFQPGTAADVLITTVTGRGLVGKILGHLPVTADLIHSGAGPDGVDLESKYKVGSRLKARVICNFPAAKSPKLGISVLPHITALRSKETGRGRAKQSPLAAVPFGSVIDECSVRHVEPAIGLYVDIGVPGLAGFVHISQVKDGKVDALYETSGPHKVGSVHKGRVVGYSEFDGLFLISFEQSVLEQRFLRLDDVPVGEVVSCSIQKVIVGEHGVSGLVLKLAEGITGYVHETHLADIRLQHPERKFREGMTVKARVLSVRPRKRQMRMTLKKTLVNSDAPIIDNFETVAVGSQALGTISNISPHGARVEFYRGVRGFLPVSEMSEAYIHDPKEHFRIGQVLNLHVIDVDPESRKLVLSCKDPSAFGIEKQAALKSLDIGASVSGSVLEKTDNQVSIELDGSGLKAILPVGQLTDNSEKKNQSALKKIHANQSLTNLAILDKNERRRAITLTLKPSLVEAAKAGKLLRSYADAKVGDVVPGYVANIRPGAVLIQFGGNLSGVLFKTKLPKEDQEKENFGLRKHQSIKVRVVAVDLKKARLVVVPASLEEEPRPSKSIDESKRPQAHGPVQDLSFGEITDAQVVGIHATQLNVETAGKIQGRVDVSQIFDSWDKIEDPEEPLAQFKKGDSLRVRAIGLHDAKDHRFLAFSHRSFNSVLEFTAKPSDVAAKKLEPLSLERVKTGSSHLAFVNNVSRTCLWANISPVVRGRINALDASDDPTKASDLKAHFSIGQAIRVRVVTVDATSGRLDLSARSSSAPAVTWDTLKPNQVLAGSVSKVNERQLVVKLTPTLSGLVNLVDMSDNFGDVNTLKYGKGELVQVSVVEVDKSNKRVRLSTRASRVLDSSAPVVDKEITGVDQVSSGSIVRGFVKHVGDKGVFVSLGGKVTALVKISNLSDRFLKDWKEHFQVDQLVKGRVLSVETATGHVEMSLKGSVVDDNYTPPLGYGDIQVGGVVTGKVRKVEDFGAFIVVDNSANVSGLCHRSEMADKPVDDARKLYQEGDVVKAKVLSVDTRKSRISFGLKPAYFDDEDTDMDDDDEGAALVSSEDEDEDGSDADSEDGIDITGGAPIQFIGTDNMEDSDDEQEEDDDEDVDEDGDVDMSGKQNGLSAGKYDWAGDAFDDNDREAGDKSAGKTAAAKKSKKQQNKDEIQVDRTADLDANGPQTSSDYERLLLGQPDSSALWIAYMALQMQVSELPKAREIAERAIKTINIREQTEKLNVWTAYLNLEVTYGTKKTVDEVFQRACQYNDSLEVHERLATAYIQAGKHKQADDHFQTMVSKFGSKSPDIWTNYAHFLHATRGSPDRARGLLPRATQALGEQHAATLMSKFGALEFRSPNGDAERGRTMFEQVLSTWPKRFDYWNQLADLEVSAAAASKAEDKNGEEDKKGGGKGKQGKSKKSKKASVDDDAAGAVRDVFERGARVKGLKPKRAMKWFKRWADWEEQIDPKGRDRVMAKAQEWVAAAQARKEAEAEAEADEDGDE